MEAIKKKAREAKKNSTENEDTRVRFGIRAKLLGTLVPVVILVIAGIILGVYFKTSDMLLKKGEQLLTKGSESAINRVEGWLNETVTALNLERDALEYFKLEPQEELNYLRHTVDKYDSFPAGIYFADTSGKFLHASFVPDASYSVFQKSWYNDGIKSDEFVLSPVYLDTITGSYVVSMSGKLKGNSGNLRGVAAADIYLDAIASIVEKVKFEETGGMFLADKATGIIIGHKDPKIVGTELSGQKNPMYSYISQLSDKNSEGLYTFSGAEGEIYVNLVNVPSTNWMAAAYVPKNEIMRDLNTLTEILVSIAFVAIIILLLLISLLVKMTVAKPIKEIDYVARQIAEGKLNESIDYRSGDEFGALAVNFNKTVSRLRDYVNYIDEISFVLEEIAKGKLSFELKYDYAGEFTKVKAALMQISASLNDTMLQINESSDDVTSGADQVSAGAQALAQGTTEQAGSIEELAATINEVSEKITNNAHSAGEAKASSEGVAKDILNSNSKMHDMIGAMANISSKSDEISKIIKTIEDIAFQTNILALNAAVEAARAGSAGKGFAVVADEVRNLAGKSSNAAKNTTVLIAETIKAVNNGAVIADDTAASMLTVVENIKQVTSLVDNIAKESDEQAVSVSQVTLGINQISAVVQTNSATAEESAAASAELLEQAKKLRQLVSRFEINENI